MMDILDLRYLAAAANVGNFGRAVKLLGLETSTISRRIARLEDELGLALFERAKTGVHLTVRIPMMSPRYSGTMSPTIPISSHPVFRPDLARS